MDATLRTLALAKRPHVEWGWLVTHASLVDILDLMDLAEYQVAIDVWLAAERPK